MLYETCGDCSLYNETWVHDIANLITSTFITNRTAANIAVSVKSVVIQTPILASTMLAGSRKHSNVIAISRTERRYVCIR